MAGGHEFHQELPARDPPLIQEYGELLGRFPAPTGSLDAKSVKLYDEPAFTGFRLQVRVYDGLSICGILLIPRSATVGVRRPVVFTVNGFQDRPEDVVTRDRLHHKFAARLAERGYVVFAPMISVQDGAKGPVLFAVRPSSAVLR